MPEVKRSILERYAGERQVFVLTNGELKAYILKVTDQWFGLTSVQIAVAVLVAILGIVNTLTVSITDRRRELGVLQAVGGLHTQIRVTIWMEALTIGLLGVTTSLVPLQALFDRYVESVDQKLVQNEGNAILIKYAPELDYIRTARLLDRSSVESRHPPPDFVH